MDKYEIELTFTEEVLGATPKRKQLYKDYIIGKAVDAGLELSEEQIEEELQSVKELEEKGWTGFLTVDGNPVIRHHVVKGFFKEACSMLRRVEDTESSDLRAHKKVIDGLVFVEPGMIPLKLPKGGKIEVNERPLRAQTAKGERVTLARSDTCPAGTTMEFTVKILGQVTESLLREWLNYGELRGLRQWRNAGYGTFTYTMKRA